jgi:probable DNA metabolism protein
MIVVYDGSIEGFLSLVYKVYYDKLQPTSIMKEMPQTLFLDEVIEIETQLDHSHKVLDALKEKFTSENFNRVLHIFMCDSREFELDLLHYIIVGFKNQKELSNINNQNVFKILELEKELFRTVHLMYGFVRFEELDDGTLYVKVENKFNIVYFLAKHFLKRFNNQKFIIHDINRKIAYIKNTQMQGIQEVAEFDIPEYSQNEEKFQNLWKKFFNTVTIESRENKKAQQNFVPLLYRTYMTEFMV